jgi:hypothetical protein
MERLDIHVALEVCEIVIESATLMPIVFALSGSPNYVARVPCVSFGGDGRLDFDADPALLVWF